MNFLKWITIIVFCITVFFACGGGGGAGGNDAEGINSTDQNGGSNQQASQSSASIVVLAANDLGMHCMDREFSVFSILPPFNVVHAQVLSRNTGGLPMLMDDTRIDIFYDGVEDSSGSINTYSATGPVAKTDFWDWSKYLFNADLQNGEGLTGLFMPADDPSNRGAQPLGYQPDYNWFTAEGIPVTPVDDEGSINPFGMMRILARDSANSEVGHLDIVVPVASETDCQTCHRTGEIAALGSGWSDAADGEVQSKINILRLHDTREQTNLESRQPVLCAQCHYSPALDLSGTGPTTGLPTFSEVMHRYHGRLTDNRGQFVFTNTLNGNCYMCHPGRITQCQRGAMATANLDCFDCHGDLLSVGGEYALLQGGSIDGNNDQNSRRPWLDLPRCQSCHTGDAVSYLNTGTGLVHDAAYPFRLRQAYTTGDPSASPITAAGSRFAENAGTLYRFSRGHSGIFCEGCHGSTHAIWPNKVADANDNVAAVMLQGYEGVIRECTVCHEAGSLPLTTGGPHGLHNIADSRWYSEDGHGERYARNKAACKACHGIDLNGTPLSKIPVARTLRAEERTVQFSAGDLVGCNHCHQRPSL